MRTGRRAYASRAPDEENRMIKLYGIPMSRASRSLWMLEEIGIPYENVPTSFVGDVQKPEYLAKNPNGRIPTLDDDGTLVWESMAINLHLAEKYDKGFRPRTLEERAHTVQWSFWGMTEIEPGLLEAFVNRVMLPEAQRNAAAADAGEQKLQRPLAVLERQLSRAPFLLGDRFGLADLNVASVLAIAPIARIDLAAYPNVQRWLAACTGRPAARKAMGRA
jgi:glutathione S-transferase